VREVRHSSLLGNDLTSTLGSDATLRNTKVLVLFSASGLGGAERSLSRMALCSNRSDITYKLGTLGGTGAWADWIENLGERPLVSNVLAGRFVRIGALFPLIKAVRSFTPDILYVVGVRAATLVRLLAPFLGRVKVVHGIRTTFKQGTALSRNFLFAELLLKGLTDAYIANSAAGARSLMALVRVARHKVHVIQNGIAIPPEVLEFRGSRPKTIVIVANIHPVKGHREFMDVIELVHIRHPDAKFQFVGRDDMAGEIDRIAVSRGFRSAVEFAGFQLNVWKWLLLAQVFVLPSRDFEGSPTAILEALGAGLPVVAFSVGGIPKLVRDGIDGYVVEHLDTKAMANAIVSLLDDPSHASRMGFQGRVRVLSEFSLEASANSHAQLWHELMQVK
jgi:glycosyltransferase involved in cell wall biosynthesis